jgi:hypothetical protein
MRGRLALGVCLLFSVASCGDDGSAGSAPESDVSTEEAQLCQSEIRPLLSALQELDSRLNVGLNLDEYGDFVGDAQVEYDRLDIDGIGEECLSSVAVPLEEALNQYITAVNKWNDCIQSVSCEDPPVQKHWTNASEEINKASDALDKIVAILE